MILQNKNVGIIKVSGKYYRCNMWFKYQLFTGSVSGSYIAVKLPCKPRQGLALSNICLPKTSGGHPA